MSARTHTTLIARLRAGPYVYYGPTAHETMIEAADEIKRLRAALLTCARQAEALKRDCGMDPESAQAIRNAQYQSISTTAHIALGTIKGPVT